MIIADSKLEEKQKNEKIYGGSYDRFFIVRQAVVKESRNWPIIFMCSGAFLLLILFFIKCLLFKKIKE